jgi:serine phosphatase RsbU (regulator of sigma subunit)
MSLFNNLGTLESAGLIQVAKVEPDLEYLFRHSMVQDAAYASLLETDRKRLHNAVGDAIESLYPDRKKELAAILGYHFKEAGEDERALTYFVIAGDEALAVYANQEAEIQYRSALGLMCCSGPEIAELYSGLGEALYRQNRFTESTEALRNAIDIYRSMEDVDNVARMYARLGRVEWYAGNRPEGLRVCLEGMEQVKDAPDSLGKAILIHEAARAYYFDGNSEKALPLCRQALALAEHLNDVTLQADALATLGILTGVTPEESLEALSKAVELAEANGLLQVAVRAYINLGSMTRAWRGDNDTALKCFRRSAELGKMRGVASEEFLGLMSYLSCLFAPGRLREIREALPYLEELVRKIPDNEHMQSTIKFIKTELITYEGDWDQGILQLRQVLNEYREQKNQESELNMLDELSWMMLEKHRWGEPADLYEAERLLNDVLKLVEVEKSNERKWVYPRMAILRARQGNLEDARLWIEKTQLNMSSTSSIWDDRFLMECMLEVAAASQDWDDALIQIEKIVHMEERLNFRVNYARSLIIWGDILMNRGKLGDLENAEVILRKAIAELESLGVGHYPDIAQNRLKIIQGRQRAQTLDHEMLTRELKKARHVQESLLPENPPDLPGWDLTVMLEPAHETSGDFYDFMMLPNENLGVVIADVTDKGTSAALYMALSRSLWRTFAVNNPTEPELTMAETNQRILTDTHGGLFITIFYGILNPHTGEFIYCNAGHLPAMLRRARNGSVEQLQHTGIPLGVFEGTSWRSERVIIEPGDALVLYTDGITDAENGEAELFGLHRLEQALSFQRATAAQQIREGVRSEVKQWVGKAEQADDITLMVIVRKEQTFNV